MAFLFLILMYWQKRIEQSGYFASIYREAVEKIDYDRLAVPVHLKWQHEGYIDELLRLNSDRADKFRKVKPKPKLDDATWKSLLECARFLDNLVLQENRTPKPGSLPPPPFFGDLRRYTARVSDVEDSMERNLKIYTTTISGGTDGNNWNRAPTDTDLPPVPADNEVAIKKRTEFDDQLREFESKAQEWTESAKECLARWRNGDLAEVTRRAQEFASLALKVDFSALRGRGPEFVLEFTAIIVIIFAATILGIGGVLESNQIGTLLAAIAGYVLGKASSRNGPATTTVQGASAQDASPSNRFGGEVDRFWREQVNRNTLGLGTRFKDVFESRIELLVILEIYLPSACVRSSN